MTSLLFNQVNYTEYSQSDETKHHNSRIHLQIINTQPSIHDEISHAVLGAEGLGKEQH